MPIVVNHRGDVFLEFLPGAEAQIPEADQHIPLTHALVVARHEGRFLLMFNRWRDEWEVPGGGIDPGESPADCAIRELFEETGQRAGAVTPLGLMKFRLHPDERVEYGGLFACTLAEAVPFVENNEAAGILWWDGHSPVEGRINEIDVKLIELCNQYGG